MEQLKDVLNSLKERFSSPLVFSFICSWLIWNWRVVIALSCYNAIQFQEKNHISIIQYIAQNVTVTRGIWLPLSFAILYVLLAPIIRNWIEIFNSWCYKWGERRNLRIVGEGVISARKYIRFKQDFDERTKTLVSVLEDEENTSRLYNVTLTELLKVKEELGKEKAKNIEHDQFYREFRDFRLIDGRWKNTYQKENGEVGSETVTIDGDKYIIDGKFNRKEHKFNIRNLFYDKRNKDLIFVKVVTLEFKDKIQSSEYINFNALKFETKDKMVGTENGTTQIEYTRIV